PILLSSDEKAALVDFLRNGLTDCRSKMRQAPFDHPFIIPNGWSQIVPTGAQGEGPCPETPTPGADQRPLRRGETWTGSCWCFFLEPSWGVRAPSSPGRRKHPARRI